MSNRLAGESSPYLLQHSDNPVDWFPWCSEALMLAREKDKPIFLSIGYSACHWCHVMEHESFEDEQIAQVLNDNFVSIKVDREERPDLDQIYMNAVMAISRGQGGWPLSAFLTPECEVFFGGTYWPPRSRMGMPGLDHVLHSVLDAFANRREQVTSQSRQITNWLNQTETTSDDFEIDQQLLIEAVTSLHRNFDFQLGGFGSAPKFPHAMDLSLLIRVAENWSSEWTPNIDQILEMVKINLKKMAYGGIFDHLAGGFARYSVDEFWLVPHFEKMLYDNALLAGVYLDMYSATGDKFYSMIAGKTLDYLLNYMRDSAGGFHSTEDADSEGVEGKFYVWSKAETLDALGEETGNRFCELYNVTEQGNFEGSNILNITKSYQEFADAYSIDKDELRTEMRTARRALLGIRDQRVRPAKDDKLLVSWNALAIASFAKAAVQLNNRTYEEAAIAAAEFAIENMKKDDGGLLHTWRNGAGKLDGFLDDYSYLIVAFLELYQLSFDQVWISRACELANSMIERFSDPSGGYYFTSKDQEKLISRPRSFQDSSVPSGNAMAALGLLRLGRITGNTDWIDLAAKTIEASGALMRQSPMASGQMLIAVHEWLTEPRELVVVCADNSEVASINSAFRQLGRQCVSLIVISPSIQAVEDLESVLAGKSCVDGQTALYICSGFSCAVAVVGLENVEAAITGLASSN